MLLAVLGGASAVTLHLVLSGNEVTVAESAFRLEATKRIESLKREVDTNLEQLHSVVSFFDGSEEVTEDEFRTFTSNSLDRHEALRALLWVDGELALAAPAEAIRFCSGVEADTVGSRFDDPLRRAIANVRGLDQLGLSAPFGSNAGDGQRIFAALPVSPTATGAAGYVVGLLDLHQMLTDAGEALGETELMLSVRDVTELGDPAIEGGAGDELVEEQSRELGGRRWRIACAAPPDFVARHATWQPWGALVLGLIATALLMSTVAAATSRTRIQHLVERRTHEVQAAYDTLAAEAQERLRAVSETKRLEQRLREIIDLVPDMIYVKDWNGRFLLANETTAEALGRTVDELTRPSLRGAVAQPDETLREERMLLETGLSSVVRAIPFEDAQGRRRILRAVKIPCTAFGPDTKALLCVATDITDQKHAEDVLRAQHRVLGELAAGTDPERVLADLVDAAEEIVPGMRCSVLIVDADGRHLRQGAAPSLPDFYNQAVDGLDIGPGIGSCGAAAHCGERVVVEDVMTHPNWAAYVELAEKAGIRACWSQPIHAADGEVLGTFAMYYGEPRGPEPFETELIESMAHLAGIAIERGRMGSRS